MREVKEREVEEREEGEVRRVVMSNCSEPIWRVRDPSDHFITRVLDCLIWGS